jgi:hypothetical protein
MFSEISTHTIQAENVKQSALRTLPSGSLYSHRADTRCGRERFARDGLEFDNKAKFFPCIESLEA